VVGAAVGDSLTSADVWTLAVVGSVVRSVRVGADSDVSEGGSWVSVLGACEVLGCSVVESRVTDGSATDDPRPLPVRLGRAVPVGRPPPPLPEHAVTRTSKASPGTTRA
jgi:hypothetical protein